MAGNNGVLIETIILTYFLNLPSLFIMIPVVFELRIIVGWIYTLISINPIRVWEDSVGCYLFFDFFFVLFFYYPTDLWL